MRLFYVLPEFLPRALLMSEHQTCHLLLTQAALGRRSGGLGRFFGYCGFLAWRHHQVVVEMAIRGYRHDSPIISAWGMVPQIRRAIDYPVTQRMCQVAVLDLSRKVDTVRLRGIMSGPRRPISQCDPMQFLQALHTATQQGLPATALTV